MLIATVKLLSLALPCTHECGCFVSLALPVCSPISQRVNARFRQRAVIKPIGLGSSINLAARHAQPGERELRMCVDGHNRALFERFDR